MKIYKKDDPQCGVPQIIEPDYRSAFQLLYGFCLGKGMKEELEKHPDLMAMIKPRWLIFESSN